MRPQSFVLSKLSPGFPVKPGTGKVCQMRINLSELTDAQLLNPIELKQLLFYPLSLGNLWEEFGDPDFNTFIVDEELEQ